MKKSIFLCVCLFAVLAVQAKQEEVSIARDWGQLQGTLVTPDAGSDVAVVIIAGSGPTDRNGNSRLGLSPNTYYMLARALEKAGIASLRYDKQGIGASRYTAPEEHGQETVRFEDFVADAEACVAWLKEAGFKKVVLAGHSEGSLIALVAASETPAVDAVVSISGAGYPLDEVILTQLTNQLITYNPGLILQAQSILAQLKQGKTVPAERIPQELQSLFHPTLQPFWTSQIQYDPREVIRRVRQPVLIAGGDNDVQVTPDNARELAKAQPKARLHIIGGMTHVLKPSHETDMQKQMLTVYMNGELPISEELVAAITEFINNL